MQTRREILTTLAGAMVLAGCTEGGDDQTGNSDETSPDDDGEPTADEAKSEGSSDNDSPDCAATVTIESGGMEPNLSRGDKVCIVQYESYQPIENPEETGIITAETGENIGYEKFGGHGDIIRYYPDGDEETTPVLARAIRWENGSYITKGDQNSEPYPWDAPVESIIGVVRSTLE